MSAYTGTGYLNRTLLFTLPYLPCTQLIGAGAIETYYVDDPDRLEGSDSDEGGNSI